jgi:hypothetical protein
VLLIFRRWGFFHLGIILVLVGVVSPAAYFLLHPSVARLSSRAGLTNRSTGRCLFEAPSSLPRRIGSAG